MNDRSNEIIKQLNRLANNRTLPMQARNKMLEAARHIKDLHDEFARYQKMYLEPEESNSSNLIE